MYIDKARLAQQLNRSVVSYDEHAVVQKKMAHRLLLGMRERKIQARRILELGCGTGYLTQLLVDHFPYAHITAIDLSEEMIEMAYENVEPCSRVEWVVGDAEKMDLLQLGCFDLIISNAMLQWMERPQLSIEKWMQVLMPGGWFFAATYGPETFLELHDLFEQVEEEMGLKPQHHGMVLPSIESWKQFLEMASLTQVSSYEAWHRSIYPDCRSFLESIKATGESYSNTTYNLLTTRRVLTRVMQKYNLMYQTRDGIYATYHLMQFQGCKQRSHAVSFCF